MDGKIIILLLKHFKYLHQRTKMLIYNITIIENEENRVIALWQLMNLLTTEIDNNIKKC